MAAGGSGICHEDLYGVLGLKKECSDADLRLAYRKLAMTWHPDRCSASGSSARVEEAKERFQEIQGAYSGHDFPNSLHSSSLCLASSTSCCLYAHMMPRTGPRAAGLVAPCSALRLRQAAPVRRRRLRRQRRRRRRGGARCFGHGRLPRRDGPDDEPSDASRELRGAAAAVRGHVPGRPRRRVRVRRQAATHGPPGPDPEPTTRWCQRQQAVLVGDGLRTEARSGIPADPRGREQRRPGEETEAVDEPRRVIAGGGGGQAASRSPRGSVDARREQIRASLLSACP